MLQQLWFCEQSDSKVSSLRTSFMTDNHWPPKTSFYRMRVFLTMQVVLGTVIQSIDMYAERCGGVAIYAPIRVLVANIDHLVNIYNNTHMNSRGFAKGCEEIDSPQHFHLQELVNILEVFAEWKSDSKIKANFIP